MLLRQRFTHFFNKRDDDIDHEPMRAAMLSIEQMERRGKELAAAHVLHKTKQTDRLLKRLDDNEQALIDVCSQLTVVVKAKQPIAPAGEWLLDNFYLIEEQISTARAHLPKGYSQELPRLANGPSKDLPRVYDLALAVISHGDGHVNDESLRRFIDGYQTVKALTLGELWAIPIMLRIALIENLRRVSGRIASARHYLGLAQTWANQMMTVAEKDPQDLILVIADMARSAPPMVSPFVAELARRLQGHGLALALPLTWVEQRLAESNKTIEQMVRAENQQQAADQVSVSSSIDSLRFLGAMDWREFVEATSVVEQILLSDKNGLYGAMDFFTRDRYRHVIDRLAKQSDLTEAKIAQLAIDLAAQAVNNPKVKSCDVSLMQQSHVGYYLVDDGLVQLKQEAGIHSFIPPRIQKRTAQFAGMAHATGMVATVSLYSYLLLGTASQEGVNGWQWWTLGVLVILAGSQLASVLVNWFATLLATPQPLPRMDYSQGLPKEKRTLVVIPSMLSCAQDIESLLEALEVRFLGNQDKHLHFALLTDFADAATQTLSTDKALLSQVQSGIAKLNVTYNGMHADGRTQDHFFLFHRQRLWNSQAKRWMGYERKRGKLAALNLVLRGGGVEAFSTVVGNIKALSGVKYVITLDADTQLPRNSARKLVAAMAHPLNRPHINHKKRIVDRGYGILQPRMAASLVGANRSRYAALFGSESGLDPYTRVVSDVYQDLFGEGSFVGKGIYDVDIFEWVLKDRFPDNRILSHDLLEGCYLRSGLLSNVELYEDYPARYQSDIKRHERWMRGDWQVAQWLLPWVPQFQPPQQRNPLSILSRWKIFDNLRRSLIPIMLTLLLNLGWSATSCAWLWSLAVASIFLLPGWLMAGVTAFRRATDVRRAYHLLTVWRSVRRDLLEAIFKIACLPYEASISAIAIARSISRQLLVKRKLMDWSAFGERPTDQHGLASSFRAMAISPIVALLCVILLWMVQPLAIWAAAPILLLWVVAPVFAWWLSRPLQSREDKMSYQQTQFLSKLARKTWSFFDTFVSVNDSWLPPDNFQEHPGPIVAHRTSPTNIGISLLANLSAVDFGFISVGELLQRTQNTFCSMKKMARYQGHFFNWYDTQSLQPLSPRYISSVDSGNLAGHLLTLRAGLQVLPDEPLFSKRSFEGLADTLALLTDALTAGEPDTTETKAYYSKWRLQVKEWLKLVQFASQVATKSQQSDSLQTQFNVLQTLNQHAQKNSWISDSSGDEDIRFWFRAWQKQCQALFDEYQWVCPWLLLPVKWHELTSQQALSISSSSSAAQPTPPRFDLNSVSSLRDLITQINLWLPLLAEQLQKPLEADNGESLDGLQMAMMLATTRAQQRIELSEKLVSQATEFATMDYAFLYEKSRHLLAIGYNVDEFRRDRSYYDLLASEARLCTFVAIAQGKVPQESWFALSRLLTTPGGAPMLVSWSGSMFEYLMPLLVMPTYTGTLLDQTCRMAVKRQIAYGRLRKLPWGVSESGFSTLDANLNYQYHAFGVPGLGLKRGLSEDSVVAPYASALALLLEADAACTNLQQLSAEGCEGRYGFYEAIDYTPARLSRGQNRTLVRSFMAHHQGMILLAMNAVLMNRPMQKRFESDPQFQATLLLLQEKIPSSTIVHAHMSHRAEGGAFFDPPAVPVHKPIDVDTQVPEVQLLSNGRYHVMVTNAGGGYSSWKNVAVTRWREDSTCDNWGAFVYLRDIESGAFWSAAHQPTLKRAECYAAMFSEGRAEFRRRDHDYETYSEIVVSPEDDIELRRVRITNRSSENRTIEVTSYAEVVLATQAADATQTAFSNLFVQTELVEDIHAIMCTRRPRSEAEPTPWMFHLLCHNGANVGEISYETDRMAFIGRGNTLLAPRVMNEAGPLSGGQGAVLDPVVAIRCNITLQAKESATLDWVTGVADNREDCFALAEKYQDRHFADRVFDIACTHSAIALRQINASEADAQLYRRLASAMLYSQSTLRADTQLLVQNRRGQSGLWGYAISGDLPILLLKISSIGGMELAQNLIQCHAYWRLKGLRVDLVIWNENHVGYRQQLQDQIMGLITTGTEAHSIDVPGGIFVRMAEQIPNEDRILLQAVARAIITDDRGTLEEQVNRRSLSSLQVERLTPSRRPHRNPARASPQSIAQPDLLLRNRLGGFTADGKEYCITSTPTQTTPLPWVNVLANSGFGTVITESGLAYSWCVNAHEFRLTPWSDDTVGASGGEAYYLRDEETGQYWSPSALPCQGKQPYITHHGFGYSRFEHVEFGIHSRLNVYVHLHESVKFSVLTVRNDSKRSRTISATGYVEWVLGELRSKSAPHVITGIDALSGALTAHNSYNTEFANHVAFFDVDDSSRTFTGDRTEFLGRYGSLPRPDALTRSRLSGRVGAGLDPCGAIQVTCRLAPGEEREIIFRLGAGHSLAHAQDLAQRMRKAGAASIASKQVNQYWHRTLSTVQVKTPDPALNILTNGWLLYQTLACRLWARSGFYQSGGAFGFRDQLQDVMALVHAEPTLVREHLLRAAARQYPEGDVQHWWHPPLGRGVRTRCSDDYLWLPLATCHYLNYTNDLEVLDENMPFIDGRQLNADEESYYDLPVQANLHVSLYQHCVRAILNSLRMGEHGLPLMGSGDWNDGMNLVGIGGKGESVWLGFLLHKVLLDFAKVALSKDDADFAARCQQEATRLQHNIDLHGWDGHWYRRAYFDDGTPLGSISNPECTIDSIAQSWSVLSGAGTPKRSLQAMHSLHDRLVRHKDKLVQLLDPPFNKSSLNPGYIKGYVPGVRENGGQYTHAAIWAAMAFAMQGDSRRAWELQALINPINHIDTDEGLDVYKAEPYVVAADVYAIAPHTGRAGWTWYTGSASWLYRLMLESLLGLKRKSKYLCLAPCIPPEWPGFSIEYRYKSTPYHIEITQRLGVETTDSITIKHKGTAVGTEGVPLEDDQQPHLVEVFIVLAAKESRA